MRLFPLFTLACLFASPAFAQISALDGWRRSLSETIPTRITYVNSAERMFAYFHPMQVADVTSLDKRLVELAVEMDKPDACPGLSKGQGNLHAGGAIKEVSLGACTVFVGKGPRGGFYAVGFDIGGNSGGARKAVMAVISAEAGVNLGGGVSEAAAYPSPKIISGAVGDDALQKAMASIPAANRPIAMVLINEWDSVAMSMAYKPRILFANGYAVDECDSWDMAKTAPTPGALAAIGSDCSVEEWKKVGGNYIFKDSDGDWSEPGEAGSIKGFQKGQRVDIDKSYVGGGAQPASLPGTAGHSHLNSGSLKLTLAGSAAIGDWFSTSVYTRDVTVQSTVSNENAVEGRYYLDGYIIAVQATDGTISFGTIGQKQEDKLYIYMNGELYW